MKRVFVIEKDSSPMLIDRGIHVEAMPTIGMATARMEITPIPRLDSEKPVPYVSVDTLKAFIAEYGADPELEALIRKAEEGL